MSKFVNWGLWCGFVISTIFWLTVGVAEDLTVLQPKDLKTTANRLLYEHLQAQSYPFFEERTKRYEALQTPADCREYQQRLQEFFVRQLGGFPDRCPLQAEVVGRIPGDGYSIEKVIFASQPHHHVTANLYLPITDQPVPCVVVACGHSRTAKAADYNQRFGIIMAKNGIAALCYDPIGQGERSMILDDQGQPKYSGTTTEHLQMGVGSILLGTNTARYRVWDAMRAIDYVQSRPEIQATRIGFTGCSGGGTLTSYVMALDDRVTCAAPSCYLTTFRHLVDSIGPQDAEQNIFGQIAFGMDHPDYVMMRAPRPTLISATNGDYFSITGAWENLRQAKRFYGRIGHSERVDLVEGDGPHGVPLGNLNAIMRWMRRWLLEKDDAPTTTDFVIHDVNELQCLSSGQVMTLPEELSVADLNAQWLARLDQQRADDLKSLDAEALRQKVRQLVNIGELQDLPAMEAVSRGVINQPEFQLERLLLKSASGCPLPALLCRPTKSSEASRLCLYLPSGGKAKCVHEEAHGQKQFIVDATLGECLRQGNTVLLVDLPGIGETRPAGADNDLGAWKEFFLAYLLGKSIVGLRAEATLQAASWLQTNLPGTDPKAEIHLVASGEAAVGALHAAALSDFFATVELRESIRSWRPIVGATETKNQLIDTVHGALRVYDLPDLSSLHGNVRYIDGE